MGSFSFCFDFIVGTLCLLVMPMARPLGDHEDKSLTSLFLFSFLKKKEGMDGGNLYLVPAARLFCLDWCLDFNRVGGCSLTFDTTSINVFLAFFLSQKRIKDRKRTPLRFVAAIPPGWKPAHAGRASRLSQADRIPSPLAGLVFWSCWLFRWPLFLFKLQ